MGELEDEEDGEIDNRVAGMVYVLFVQNSDNDALRCAEIFISGSSQELKETKILTRGFKNLGLIWKEHRSARRQRPKLS